MKNIFLKVLAIPSLALIAQSQIRAATIAWTNTGGGNTSSKLIERDPLSGEDVEVLWIKGSGGDLRTAKADGFASLYLEKVRAMKQLYLNHPEPGPKTEVEDRMYPMYNHCVFGLNPRACSIDTPCCIGTSSSCTASARA